MQVSELCVWSELRITISSEHLLKMPELIGSVSGSSEFMQPWAYTTVPTVCEAGGKAWPKHTPDV